MGFNQQNVATYFVVFVAEGNFGNTVIGNAPTPLSPGDFERMERDIQRKGGFDARPVIINFKKIGG